MTSGQLETYLRSAIKGMQPPVNGDVYFRGMRPVKNEIGDEKKQDLVVAVIAGDANQLQRGSCLVNAYVPDIVAASGVNYCDKSTCDNIAVWLDQLPDQLSAVGDVYFKRSSIVLTLPNEATKEHFVSLKMDFQFLNDNNEPPVLSTEDGLFSIAVNKPVYRKIQIIE